MTAKYQNRYRIATARADWWDYGWNGAYFITICTMGGIPYFGGIGNGKMKLSSAGVLADLCWYQIPQRNPDVELGPFVIMPNHMHGILILNRPETVVETMLVGNENGDGLPVETLHATSLPKSSDLPVPFSELSDAAPPVQDFPGSVETLHATSLPNNLQIPNAAPSTTHMAAISPKPSSVPVIVRSYKSAVQMHANRLGLHLSWQSRYWDHIIRSQADFEKIAAYIRQNPELWDYDVFKHKT